MPEAKKPEEKKSGSEILDELKAKNERSEKLVDDILTADRLLLKNIKALRELKKKNGDT